VNGPPDGGAVLSPRAGSTVARAVDVAGIIVFEVRFEVHVMGPGDHHAHFEIERDAAPREGELDHSDVGSMAIHFKVLRVEAGVIHAEWQSRPGPSRWG
jgi:hypothetical protein